MLKIAISCGEGFASGFLSKHLSTSLKKDNLQDKVVFSFIPYPQLVKQQDEVDIAILMPHVEHKAKADHDLFHIPLYVNPYKIPAIIPAVYYVEDAEDIIALADGKGGLITFPDEPRAQHVTRTVSHRRWLEQQNKSRRR